MYKILYTYNTYHTLLFSMEYVNKVGLYYYCLKDFTFFQDVTKLTALSPEVISRQATINIGKLQVFRR